MLTHKKEEETNLNKEKDAAILKLYQKMDQMQDLMQKLSNRLLNKDKQLEKVLKENKDLRKKVNMLEPKLSKKIKIGK